MEVVCEIIFNVIIYRDYEVLGFVKVIVIEEVVEVCSFGGFLNNCLWDEWIKVFFLNFELRDVIIVSYL